MATAFLFTKMGHDDAQLEDVAAVVFGALQVHLWEERFSANYPPDEHYFAAYAENATIEVQDHEIDRMPEYPFLVSIEQPSTLHDSAGVINTDPQEIARLLASKGLTVFVPNGKWYRLDWDGKGQIYEG